jgi:uncharacterized membrane protein
VVVISVWIRYTRIMSALPIDTRRTLLLNTILLFTISMEPFLFNILRSRHSANPAPRPLLETSSELYGVDLGAMMLIMAVFTLALAAEEKHLVPKSIIRQLRWEATTLIIAAGVFVISASPVFGIIEVGGVLVTGLSARIVLWLIALLISWVIRGGGITSEAALGPTREAGNAGPVNGG